MDTLDSERDRGFGWAKCADVFVAMCTQFIAYGPFLESMMVTRRE